ncbi:SRPBCC family protein [Eilatimonas milleporae]|uniref:Polyketide cyclase/dehydrase/lipid transport protein n=1 Tax=Eilatimonas milleporae TaxID=911205 RepID=A0A3M0C045_9PROT|nr:SRPBCC family protein [Eilatimonas milleporae]RMB02672.1 hypothetical protein BXY39_3022 [Eilatimonas milleporae]
MKLKRDVLIRMNAQAAKLPFADWNLYHKSVVAVLAAFFVAVLLRAVTAVDGGDVYHESARVFEATPEMMWPWVTTTQDRVRWQAGIVDISRLTGAPAEPASTRLLFWREDGRRWSAVERTEQVVRTRVFEVIQQSDRDDRRMRIELVPEGPCRTRVIMMEWIRATAYRDRFWAFLYTDARQGRLETSLDALGRWIGYDPQPCSEG